MKKWLGRCLPLLLLLLPPVLAAVYLSSFAVDLPWWDQWLFVPSLRALYSARPESILISLWAQHNEHRIFFAKMILFALARISAWNVTVEMWFSLFVSALTLVGLAFIYRKAVGRSWWGFVPIAWLAFSLGQWENILLGFALCLYLQVLAAVFAFYLLSGTSWRSEVAALLCGVVASLSFSSGLLVWPVGLVQLLALRAPRPRLVLWSLVGIATCGVYFTDYTTPKSHPPLLAGLFSPITTARFFLSNVGAPLGGGKDLSLAMGTCLVVLMGLFLASRIRRDPRLRLAWSASDVVAATLVMLSLLTSAVITVSRVGFGHIEWAASSRYTTLGTLGIVGFYMLLLKDNLLPVTGETRSTVPLRTRLFSALLALLFVGLVTTNSEGVAMGKIERERRLELQLTLLTFETQSDQALRALLPWDGVRDEARFLKAQGLSVFRQPKRQPQDALQEGGASPP